METPLPFTGLWSFTPSRNTPEELEAILVQRQGLLADAVERVRESASSNQKHHLLFVGPRGTGKTFLVSLIVSRIDRDATLADRLRIAWLNEDETSATTLDLLLKIHSALCSRYPGEFDSDPLRPAYELQEAQARAFVGQALLKAMGSRTLLVVTENLDALFECLGEKGQQELRAFIQENPRFCIVATAQRLVEDLSSRTKPFFGFFQTEYLKPLNLEEATELLRKIARAQEKTDVVEFLDTPRGRSRVRALHHLAGGNHRIYIVLSQFITRDSIDSLVGPFLKMIDELTPYYQERIRWLPPLQRRIVEHLCRCDGTVPVKEIAKHLFSTQQTVSRQLQELREKGYVEAHPRGREMLYDIAEPLLRICVEVKDNSSRRPIRLLVDFLRAWYDDGQLKDRLSATGAPSGFEEYLLAAIERNQKEGNLRKNLLIQELFATLPSVIPREDTSSLRESAESLPEEAVHALQCWNEGRDSDAKELLEQAQAQLSDPAIQSQLITDVAFFLVRRTNIELEANNFGVAASLTTQILGLPGLPERIVPTALFIRGFARQRTGETILAREDLTAAIEHPNVTDRVKGAALAVRGTLDLAGASLQEAAADLSNAYDLLGDHDTMKALVLFYRARCRFRLGDRVGASDDYGRLLAIGNLTPSITAIALLQRGFQFAAQGRFDDAIKETAELIRVISAPRVLVHHGLFIQALAYVGLNHPDDARRPLTRLIEADDVETSVKQSALMLFAGLCAATGDWHKVLQSLNNVLALESASGMKLALEAVLVISLFSSDLPAARRNELISALYQTCRKHTALPRLGEELVRHMGQVFQEGEPFPAADTLDPWLQAWEQASGNDPEFQIPLRLLRTAIEFLKSGGKDAGVLLDLSKSERSLLRQALGLEDEA